MPLSFASAVAIVLALGQSATLNVALVHSTLDSLAEVVNKEYFDATVAERVAASLKALRASGRVDAITKPETLAALVNSQLFALTKDKHLRMAVISTQPAPPAAGTPAPSPTRDTPTTAGVARVELLPDQIGVLEMTMFLRPVEHRNAIAAAMKTLAPAKALIIDMRHNGGGSPGTIALVMSYLFDEPGLPLFDIIPREGDVTSYTTEPATASLPRNGTRPIFVLTSNRTFSGGEGLAYLLQERQRATIIGERTAGAANPGRPYPVNDLFEVTVPNGHIRSAINQSNWEGDGVKPDVMSPADAAFDVALERARAALKGR